MTIKLESQEFILYFNKDDILSGVAKWGVAQSPYHRPDNLEIVLDKLSTLLTKEFKSNEYISGSRSEIIDLINKTTRQIPEFVAWNERKNGNQDKFAFVSRYGKPDPDNDFIDLDALSMNIALDIKKAGGDVMTQINLTEPELKHLINCVMDATKDGSYRGNKDQYYKRTERILEKLRG